MLTLKRILLPVDGSACSRNATSYALSLAQQTGAQVFAIHVSRPRWVQPVEEGSLETSADVVLKLQEEAAADTERLLGEVAEAAKQAGITLETCEMSGNPPRSIVQFAKQVAADLVVMGTHGRSGIARAVLGSVTEDVIRHAPCPVLVVRQTVVEKPQPACGAAAGERARAGI